MSNRSKKRPKKRRATSGCYKSKKVLATTLTGEIVQPIRLHYERVNTAIVSNVFTALSCMEFDSARQRWVWLYKDESRDIALNQPKNKATTNLGPVVLGSIFSPEDDHMYIDLNSFERAVQAVLFFDRVISRKSAALSYVQFVNALFESGGDKQSTHDHYFDKVLAIKPDPEAVLIKTIEGIKQCTANDEEAMALFIQKQEEDSKKPFPMVESFPANYYEDKSIDSFEQMLNIRQHIAMEHWKGNSDFSFYDILQKIV
ncbi:MAG: hypothetical protein Q9M09_05710 [Mariprofundaceae bacterium]|nr:hypothetical protein [Mariprofundaceae bacterium]